MRLAVYTNVTRHFMNSREILAVAIKVFGLWFLCQLFIQAASFSPMLLSLGAWQNSTVPSWAIGALSVSFFVSGSIIAFILFRLGNNLLSSPPQKLALDLNHGFVLQVCGLFFMVNALIKFPSAINIFFIPIKHQEITVYLPFVGYVVQFIIGSLLLVNSSWWVYIFKKLRGRA